MVNEHSRYIRDSKSKDEKTQTRIGKHGKLEPSVMQIEVKMTQINYLELVWCPFCLYEGKRQEYLISTAKGISQGNAQCPKCNLKMRMKSLLTNQTPEQYADWVYDYRSSGFFQKIKFDSWKKRLWEVGWSMRFWTRYKALKGEDADKTFDGKLDFATREEEDAYNAQAQNQ